MQAYDFLKIGSDAVLLVIIGTTLKAIFSKITSLEEKIHSKPSVQNVDERIEKEMTQVRQELRHINEKLDAVTKISIKDDMSL